MSQASGYIVRLDGKRYSYFSNMIRNNHFEEPVPDFEHSRNVPLICFILNPSNQITHVGLGKRGMIAGTGLRRLNLFEIIALDEPVLIDHVCKETSSYVISHMKNKLNNGGLLPPRTFQELIIVLSRLSPKIAPTLQLYSVERKKRIAELPERSKEIFAEQKEALVTALTIAGINRYALLNWDFDENKKPESFLDGLSQVRLREDSMIINDLTNVPGYAFIKSTQHNYVFFSNEVSELTVVLANRQPLEELFGVDLIYYNETFKCFIMVQYKALEKEGYENVFRIPDQQLTIEINRMNDIIEHLNKCSPNETADGFRLSNNPFFLKFCSRIVFEPDNVGLVSGMYLPLDYWELLEKHPTLKGKLGGKRLTFNNVRRYFDNTAFTSLVSGGWVGSSISQSKILEELIKSTLESGRAVVLAVNKELDLRRRENDKMDVEE